MRNFSVRVSRIMHRDRLSYSEACSALGRRSKRRFHAKNLSNSGSAEKRGQDFIDNCKCNQVVDTGANAPPKQLLFF